MSRWTKKILFLLLVAASGTFYSGCKAQAANVMITHRYQFAVINDIVITSMSPANNTVASTLSAPIDVAFTHTLPITAVSISVKINGADFAGTQVVTGTATSKRVIWTPTTQYPLGSAINWVLNVEVATP